MKYVSVIVESDEEWARIYKWVEERDDWYTKRKHRELCIFRSCSAVLYDVGRDETTLVHNHSSEPLYCKKGRIIMCVNEWIRQGQPEQVKT